MTEVRSNCEMCAKPTATMSRQENDTVASPRHYAGDGRIECMAAMRSMMHGAEVEASAAYWWGCAFKYLWRWLRKNGVEDLRKCRQCIDYLIAEVEP